MRPHAKRTPSAAEITTRAIPTDIKRPRLIIKHNRESSISEEADSPSTLQSDNSLEPSRQDSTSTVPSFVPDDDSSEEEVSSDSSETSDDEEYNSEDGVEEKLPLEQHLLLNEANDMKSRLTAWQGSPTRTAFDTNQLLSDAKNLQSRLTAFLPKLQQANHDTTARRTNINIGDVAADASHVQLNLGLGVLEHRGHHLPVFDSTSEEDSRCGSDDEQQLRPYGMQKPTSELGDFDDEPDVMRHLLGMERRREHPGIEELDGITKSFKAVYPIMMERSGSRGSSVSGRETSSQHD